jgi:hypothetical protein
MEYIGKTPPFVYTALGGYLKDTGGFVDHQG